MIIYFINIIYYHINTSLIIKFHFSSYVMSTRPNNMSNYSSYLERSLQEKNSTKVPRCLILNRTMSRYISKIRLVKARDGVGSESSPIKSALLHVECLEHFFSPRGKSINETWYRCVLHFCFHGLCLITSYFWSDTPVYYSTMWVCSWILVICTKSMYGQQPLKPRRHLPTSLH